MSEDNVKLVTAFVVTEEPQEAVNVQVEHLDFTRTTPIPDSSPCTVADFFIFTLNLFSR